MGGSGGLLPYLAIASTAAVLIHAAPGPAPSAPDPGCVRSCRASASLLPAGHACSPSDTDAADDQAVASVDDGSALPSCCPSDGRQNGCWPWNGWPNSYGCKRRSAWGREYLPGKTIIDAMMVDTATPRFYGVHLPASYTINGSAELPPLVISMHGWGGRTSQHEALTGLSALADQEGFVVVYPQGLGDANTTTGNWFSWNGVGSNGTAGSKGPVCDYNHTLVHCYRTCSAALDVCDVTNPNGPCSWTTCADDVLFLEKLLDQLQKSICFDLRRVYMTGFSNGAMWNFQMANSRLAGRIAAFAPVSGSPHYGYNAPPNLAADDSPMPLLVLHGHKDGVIPANTSVPGQPYTLSNDSYVGWRYTKTSEVLELWAKASGSDAAWSEYKPPLVSTEDVAINSLYCVKRANTRHNVGSMVVSCTWSGGHQWAGVAQNPMRKPEVPAAAYLVWGFLREHTL